ncbi:hypothetical protein P9857_01580, partial [Anoxybacillus geothermalis]|nr:hypothetical protein [Anoxybacillus geothermalis]
KKVDWLVQLRLIASLRFSDCLASARRRSGSNNLRLRDVNIPAGEEHLPIAIARMAIFRRYPQDAGCF